MPDNCKTKGSRPQAPEGALDQGLHTGLDEQGFLLHFQLDEKLDRAYTQGCCRK